MYVMLLMLIFIPNCQRVEIVCGLYNVQYPAACMQGWSLCSLTLQICGTISLCSTPQFVLSSCEENNDSFCPILKS